MTLNHSYQRQLSNAAAVYNIYRIVLPLILLFTYLGNSDTQLLGIVDGDLFVTSNVCYTLFALAMATLGPRGANISQYQHIMVAALLVDVLAVGLVIYTSGGTISGLGLLLLVTVAAAGILLRGRISTFIAAIAAIATIYIEVYLSFSLESASNQLFQTGILGLVLFGISLYIQAVSERFYSASELAAQQASDITDLQQLNAEIIHRMRTGIVVVNRGGEIVTLNSAAKNQLNQVMQKEVDSDKDKLPLPSILRYQLQVWENNPQRQPRPITFSDTGKQFQINFAYLNPGSESDILIFLEDNSQIVQRVQQMKLASLGKLTASIAHEIRNPLGAISHASQLLKESKNIQTDDHRMIEIILEHCKRVDLIINDVLDVSRHKESAAERISLGEWLHRFVNNYRETYQGEVEIDLSVIPYDAEVHVITTQLEQVLNNLFDNGLRYSKKQTGRACLTIEAGIDIIQGEYQPYIHVIDDGPGIPAAAETRLFEPFHTTETSGTGLGLYISRELCEANQSQLVYHRTEVGKSCFSIFFSHPDRHFQ